MSDKLIFYIRNFIQGYTLFLNHLITGYLKQEEGSNGTLSAKSKSLWMTIAKENSAEILLQTTNIILNYLPNNHVRKYSYVGICMNLSMQPSTEKHFFLMFTFQGFGVLQICRQAPLFRNQGTETVEPWMI